MPTPLQNLDTAFRTAIKEVAGLDMDPAVAPSAQPQFADYQCNAAMGIAKQLKSNPRQFADKLKLAVTPLVSQIASEVSVAGPGFINIRLSPTYVGETLLSDLKSAKLGVDPAPTPQRVVVDYSAPNIAKEMHVGHLRSTIIGDSIARILEFLGHEVIRQNHLGDWGRQFGRVVIGLWYLGNAREQNKADELFSWAQRLMSTLRELKEKSGDAVSATQTVNDIVRKVGAWHQANLDRDPKGTQVFFPFLKAIERGEQSLQLHEMELLYTFVNAVEGTDLAKQIIIRRPATDEYSANEIPLSEQSLLVTPMIQHPGVPTNAQEELAYRLARKITMRAAQETYDRLGVGLKEAHEKGESQYSNDLPAVVRDLIDKGIAVESEGAKVVFIDGPDKNPLIIEKSKKTDNDDEAAGYLYGTTDLAAARYRVNVLHADRALYFVDARQSQHFAQVFKTAKTAGWAGSTSFEHAAFGTMLGADGKPFKSRSGDVAKLADLLDEAEERALAIVKEKSGELPGEEQRKIARAVGIGAIKYADLSKDRVSDYVFDWDRMLSLEGNTSVYLQYAYARVKSIFRKGGIDPATLTGSVPALTEPAELGLGKTLLRFGEVLETVAKELKPHLLCTYLYELSGKFSSFYAVCQVLDAAEPARMTRLQLSQATARTLKTGLGLLGIECPEQM